MCLAVHMTQTVTVTFRQRQGVITPPAQQFEGVVNVTLNDNMVVLQRSGVVVSFPLDVVFSTVATLEQS